MYADVQNSKALNIDFWYYKHIYFYQDFQAFFQRSPELKHARLHVRCVSCSSRATLSKDARETRSRVVDKVNRHFVKFAEGNVENDANYRALHKYQMCPTPSLM